MARRRLAPLASMSLLRLWICCLVRLLWKRPDGLFLSVHLRQVSRALDSQELAFEAVIPTLQMMPGVANGSKCLQTVS